ADGTIYHTYGGRDWTDPMSHLAVPVLARLLVDTLADHAAYERAPRPPKLAKKRTIEQIPKWARQIKRGKRPDCFHCHMVHDGEIAHLQERREWTRARAWLWPDPIQVGLRLGQTDQTRVKTVEPGSAAERTGLRAGDRLVRLAETRPATLGDVQRVLHETPNRTTTIRIGWVRGDGDRPASGLLRLEKGWKEATPLVYSWRASKWPLSPKPGFGGRMLTPEQRASHGLSEATFAFRVGYIVTWGPDAHTGRNAARAGISMEDIVVSVGGKCDFENMGHFHAWFRLTQKPGTEIPVELIREGRRLTVKLKVIE
ncbi:MAG: PDZ domain-containing protein, partial [Planctomycetota bacterium]